MTMSTGAAVAGPFVEPPVFASQNGVLDLLLIATPKPVPSIVFTPSGGEPLNPTGWIYQICRRAVATGNSCPAGSATSSEYGGTRLALQKGDTLKIHLVNQLPLLDPVKVTHDVDPGQANLPLNPTNLHTHGMIVQARAPTLGNPTFGDYIFVEIFNSANGTPVPQTTHQHGSIVMDSVDYQIHIPHNHPSGQFWFHPHVHGLALNQVSGGMAGIISVGRVGDYAFGDVRGTPFPEANIRHLILKDMQVMAAGTSQFVNGTANVVDGEVRYQEDPTFCAQYPASASEIRQGSCPGNDNSASGGNNYTGGQWVLTVSGQQYPTIPITAPDGEIWRLTNASGSMTYDLQLTNDATKAVMVMQLISVDGVSVNIPPATSLDDLVTLGGARFKVVSCPAMAAGTIKTAPICVTELAMMPSSRVELWVTYRDANGSIVAPPAGATGTFKMIGIRTGAAGDPWPAVDLAAVQFNQTAPRNLTAAALEIQGDALAANQTGGLFSRPVPYASAAPLPAGCAALAPGHRRRLFFGLADTTNAASFGLGYEELDQNGAIVAGTQVPVTSFDPANNIVCLPLGPGQIPVRETCELVNLATENHNFHIHQTKFSAGASATAPSVLAMPVSSTVGTGIMEDNVPLAVSVPQPAIADQVANNQSGYCLIDQWHQGTCVSKPVVVNIPFLQLGEFVYHCHILEHEDGGMMAKIQVVPSPN
jgi:FtsP/CotA-like multicopper oxidase with cupredoxin domain